MVHRDRYFRHCSSERSKFDYLENKMSYIHIYLPIHIYTYTYTYTEAQANDGCHHLQYGTRTVTEGEL